MSLSSERCYQEFIPSPKQTLAHPPITDNRSGIACWPSVHISSPNVSRGRREAEGLGSSEVLGVSHSCGRGLRNTRSDPGFCTGLSRWSVPGGHSGSCSDSVQVGMWSDSCGSCSCCPLLFGLHGRHMPYRWFCHPQSEQLSSVHAHWLGPCRAQALEDVLTLITRKEADLGNQRLQLGKAGD